MLNSEIRNILFGALTILLIGLISFNGGISFFVYPVLLFIYSWVLFYGCAYIGSNFFLPVICASRHYPKRNCPDFDDGRPLTIQGNSGHSTGEKVKAAFFASAAG